MGSHLEAQALFCQLGEKFFELEALSATRGRCTVSLEGVNKEQVRLITGLGELVPGLGELRVLHDELPELWPALSSAVLSPGSPAQVLLQGSGFRQGVSVCDIQAGDVSQAVQAEVSSSGVLSCLLPPAFV